MSERLKRKSTPSLADLSSPSVRRTSSQYHINCIPTPVDVSGEVNPARHDSIRPIALKSPGRRKSSPLSVNKSLSTIKLSPINVTFTPVIAEVDSPKISHEHEQNKTDDRIEDKVCEIIQVPQLSGIKPLINETLKNTNKENSLSIVTTPKLPRKEVVSPTFRLKRSNLLSDLGKIFNNVPVDQFMEGVKEDSFDEMTFCGQLMPLEEEPAEEKSNEELTESTLIKYMCESWKMLTSAQERRDKLYDVKCSFGSRIIQICDNVYRGLDSLNTRSPDFKGMVELFLSLSNLFELSRCWLANYPTESAISYQQTLTKLFKSAEDSINQLNDSGSNAKRTAQRYLMKLVFLIGKRLLEVNSSLEEKVWTILMEDVQDNLAKGSSTQFSVTLHTVIDQVSKSLMNVSSMSHQAFVTKKSEPIRSLLETSIELLDELQQVMKKFKIWHEFHNGENTMTKMYELQFLWHSENYQYLNLLYSLIIDYTKNIIKVIEESGCITELPLLEKILSSIKTNLNGIQSSLPFSSDNEADGDNVSESVKLLNDLEQAIRQSSTIILKQRNLITTSFICCKGILKSLPTYNPSPALELSIQSNEAESETGNYNRRVHFSNSITETATGEEK